MELIRRLMGGMLTATLVACSGEVTTGGPGDAGDGAGGSQEAAASGGTSGTSGSGATHGSSGGSAGSAPFVWDHQCKCKNWTDPSNYPTELLGEYGCVTGTPCEDGLVCCAISCVAPFPGVCDWTASHGMACALSQPHPPENACCEVFPDQMSACVKPDLCAEGGVLERRDPPKTGDKVYPMCIPPH